MSLKIPAMPFSFDEHADQLIVMMRPQDFLRLAAPIADRIPSRERRSAIAAVLDAGGILATLPDLEIEIHDNEGYVIHHDGRHRAIELRERGFDLMPVHLMLEGGSLEKLRRIYPELHDEDEEYPGFDEDSLEERMNPVPPSVFIIPPEEVKA